MNNKKLELSSIESDLVNNPVLQLIENQKTIAQEQTKLERAKQLPNLQATYNNSSFMGMAANEVYYDRSNRFHAFQVGISLPIFTSGQRNRVKSAKIAEQVAEADYTATKDRMNSRYQQLLTSHQNNEQILNSYESFSFKNSDTITKTAQLQFINGDINYLEYVMLINQAIETVNRYLDTLKMYNDNIIQINYLTSNN